MPRGHVAACVLVLVTLASIPNRTPAQVGTALHQQKISALEGNFTGPIGPQSFFGYAIAALGDLNGDGTIELAALDASKNVWILSLGTDGRVVGEQRIAFTEDRSNLSIARLGDLDGDGITELAVAYYESYSLFPEVKEDFVEI